jgi:ABC-type transport system substrate-binding protein
MRPIGMLRAGASLNPGINNAGFHDDPYTQLTDETAAEPDAGKRAQLYSQINDYILDQSFGMPVAPSTSRMLTPANVHGIEFRYNDVVYFGNAWIG